MTESVKNWIKTANRKKAKLIKYDQGVYDIVYYHKGKVRVGFVEDGMYTRYGIACRGAMSSESVFSLWQSGPGSCCEEDVKIMVDYLNGNSNLPDFDFSVIKDLKV